MDGKSEKEERDERNNSAVSWRYGLSIPEYFEILITSPEFEAAQLLSTGCGSTEYAFKTAKERDQARRALLDEIKKLLSADNCYFDN